MKKIHINNDDNYVVPPKFYEELIVPLKRYEKTTLALKLDKELGFKHRTVYEDIEQTYYDAIYEHGHTNIKIKTNLIQPQKYKFAANEVEIVC